MNLRLTTLLAGTIAMTLATAASAATVINFDDLPSGFRTLPSDYAGLNWGNNFSYYTTPQDPYNAKSGTGRIFGNTNIFPVFFPASLLIGVPTAGLAFDGLWVAGAFGDVSFDLYKSDTLVASSGRATVTSVPTFLASNFTGAIDKIAINVTNNGYWVGDDLTFSAASAAVPEPASWAMLIAGFGLTGAAMRRRRVAVVSA